MKRKWIFADWKLPSDSDLALIDDLGFTDVVLGTGVITEGGAFKAKYSDARIVSSADAIKNLGARAHIMTWIRRQRTFIREMSVWLTEICRKAGAASAMLDAEAEWHTGRGISETEAADLVKSRLQDLPCSLGVTGLSMLHTTVRPLLDVCDYGLGQAYSIWKPGSEKHWSHSPATKPGEQQAQSWASWGVADKHLVMGLSNYWAARPARDYQPKMTAEESLKAALEGAEKVGATEVAYWSLKWLHKKSVTAEAARRITANISLNEDDGEPIAQSQNIAAQVQWLLVQLGYNLGKYGPNRDGVDGFWGKLSQEALDSFRKASGLPVEGIFCLEDVTALVAEYRSALNPG